MTVQQAMVERIKECPVITSRQNTRVSQLMKLSDRKYRRAMGCFRFDGIKLATEAFLGGLPLRTVFLRAGDAERVLSRVTEPCLGQETIQPEILVLEDSLFDRVSEEGAPEGIICVCDTLPLHSLDTISSVLDRAHRIVFLESVRDPSNMGAMIRSAAAFSVDALVISEDCADIYHAKTVRASMGTLFRQPIVRVTDLPAAVRMARESGRRVFAAALRTDALRLGSFSIDGRDGVVIGNEGHGLTKETIDACDACVLIPMTDRAESLNAAVAASILMWTFCHDDSENQNAQEKSREEIVT